MTRLLLDSSVLIKWFHTEGESEVLQARAIRDAHLREDLSAHMIDLAAYEVGNVLLSALRWSAMDVADQLEDIHSIMGEPFALTHHQLRLAATLGYEHDLSFYDASWAAVAAALDISLVSADRRLQNAGLAESPTAAVRRLGLPVATP